MGGSQTKQPREVWGSLEERDAILAQNKKDSQIGLFVFYGIIIFLFISINGYSFFKARRLRL